MLSVTLRQLEYATAVGRHGGMTLAAQALHVSQPALSVAIAQLEAQLGQPLFLRQAGRITPTAFGRGWLEAAEAQLAGIARLMQGAGTAQPTRLAVFRDLAPALLAPLMAASDPARLAPEVMDFEPLAHALLTGRIDLALTWDLGLPEGIDRQILARVPPHAVLTPDHPLAAQPMLRLQDLAAAPLILTDQDLSLAHFRALFAARGLSPRIAHRAASADLMRSLAANGLGVGLGYSRPIPALSHDGRPLVTRPISDAGTEAVILARLAGNPLPPAAGDLARRIAQMVPDLLPDHGRSSPA